MLRVAEQQQVVLHHMLKGKITLHLVIIVTLKATKIQQIVLVVMLKDYKIQQAFQVHMLKELLHKQMDISAILRVNQQ
jgi:hypothetical protein